MNETTIPVIDEAVLRRHVVLNKELISTIENAMSNLDNPEVVMPPILHMALPTLNAEVDIKTAFIPEQDSLAIKISTGFFDNPTKYNIASLSGMMVLIQCSDGKIKALLQDNGYLTDIRTAAAGAIAAKYGAKPNSKRATIIGTGLQAYLQTIALLEVYPLLERIELWGRDVVKANNKVEELKKHLSSIPIAAVDDLSSSLKSADIIVTTTSAEKPLIKKRMLKPGQHITAMGSDAPYKNEIAPEVLASVTYVPDKLSQTQLLGEYRAAHDAGITPLKIIPLSEVIKKQTPIRQHKNEITVFDLTGTGIQDTAIANYAYSKVFGKTKRSNQ